MKAAAISGILVILVVAVITPCVTGDLSLPANSSQLCWGPVLTNMTPESVTITWSTGGAVPGLVEYSAVNSSIRGLSMDSAADEEVSLIHRVRIENLSPDETYMYTVSGNPHEHSFRTFPENGTIRFVVYGDTREQLPWWNQSTYHALVASRIAAEPDIRFVVHTGDLVNDPEDAGEWDHFFDAAGPLLDHVPFYPVAGNHEGSSGVLQEIFGTPPWYVISCGDLRVVVLDSNPLSVNMTTAQDHFIASNPAQGAAWTFVALHYPPYSADPNHPGGFRDVRERWEPVFRDWGVTAVFAGHVHAYEHIELGGIHYFTVATGGAPSYTLSPDKPEGYLMGLENTLGYAVVTVNPTEGLGMIEFVKVSETNESDPDVSPRRSVYEWTIIPGTDTFSGLRLPTFFTSHFGDKELGILTELN